MEKASRKLLLAFLTIAVCLALLVGATYALFSAQIGVENHLVAGNLSAKLVRENLETVCLSENGHLTRTTNGEDKDFTNAGKENLFDLTEGIKIAPGSSFTADMVLTNNGSVAFSYWIEVKLKSESNKLAEQLKVTVKIGENSTSQFLKDGLSVGNEEEGIGIVEANESAHFSVSMEFTDLDTNNDAQDQTVSFDFVVYALQDATVTPAA